MMAIAGVAGTLILAAALVMVFHGEPDTSHVNPSTSLEGSTPATMSELAVLPTPTALMLLSVESKMTPESILKAKKALEQGSVVLFFSVHLRRRPRHRRLARLVSSRQW